MELRKPGTAGTTESSDILVTVMPSPKGTIEINLKSVVYAAFGEQIEAEIRTVLEEMGIESALVRAEDKGAIDCVIRARTQAAVCRATGESFDWTNLA